MSLSTLKAGSYEVVIGYNNSTRPLGLRAGLNEGDPDDIDDLLILAYLAEREDYIDLFEAADRPTLEELQAADPDEGGTPDIGDTHYILASEKAAALGVATLDSNGKLSASQWPDDLGPGGGGGSKTITLVDDYISGATGNILTYGDFAGKTISSFILDDIPKNTGFTQVGAAVAFTGASFASGMKLTYNY